MHRKYRHKKRNRKKRIHHIGSGNQRIRPPKKEGPKVKFLRKILPKRITATTIMMF